MGERERSLGEELRAAADAGREALFDLLLGDPWWLDDDHAERLAGELLKRHQEIQQLGFPKQSERDLVAQRQQDYEWEQYLREGDEAMWEFALHDLTTRRRLTTRSLLHTRRFVIFHGMKPSDATLATWLFFAPGDTPDWSDDLIDEFEDILSLCTCYRDGRPETCDDCGFNPAPPGPGGADIFGEGQ